ncbi:MAG: tetratricopeptide repeat protein, partial [Kiritimatiellae bacterium]|nr:tetratricopeptide repeat protein [Kiritimatiellia bacterium]
MTFAAIALAAIAVLPSDRLAMADRLFNRGEYASARVEYAALAGDRSIPEDELLYRLAECDRALNRPDDARRGYSALLERFPTSAHADRARLMRALSGKREDRAAELRKLDSDRVAPGIRAAALYYLGSDANDPELLARSIRLDPNGRYAPYADFHRASLLVKSPDPAVRRKAVEILLSLAFGRESQFSDDALYLAAVQSYNEKKYGEAASIFTRYLKRHPDGKHAADVRTMAAWSNYLNGKCADAAALCGDGKTDDFAYLLGACAYATGDNASAQRLFKDYLERYPQGKYRANAELPLARMGFDAASSGGDGAGVIENAKRAYALSAQPGDALRLAWAYEKCGKEAEAEAQYAETAKKFPGTDEAAEALFRKAMADARAKKWSACDRALAEALASGKNAKRRAESLYWRGVAATQLGHEAEGAGFLEEALEAGLSLDESREARLMLADAAFRGGRADEAKAAYAKLVREGACERMNAAKLLAVGKLLGGDEAKTCAAELGKCDSAEWRQAGAVLLGATEEKAGNFTQAVAAYRRAMAEDACVADLSQAALALGVLEARAGEHDA